MLTVVLLFFYVGVESSLGGWITAYALRFGASGATVWTSAVSAFWASFLLGRLLAPLALRQIESPVYILICLALAAFGMVLLLTAQIVFLLVGAIFVGFGLAPVFPTVLAEFTRRFGAEGAGKANWLFIASTCGGAFLTWSVGFLSNAYGSLRIGFFVLFVCSLLMIALQARLYHEIKNKI